MLPRHHDKHKTLNWQRSCGLSQNSSCGIPLQGNDSAVKMQIDMNCAVCVPKPELYVNVLCRTFIEQLAVCIVMHIPY